MENSELFRKMRQKAYDNRLKYLLARGVAFIATVVAAYYVGRSKGAVTLCAHFYPKDAPPFTTGGTIRK